MNKILATCSFIAICNAAFAAQHSFYVGLQTGVSNFSAKQNSQASNDFPASKNLINNKKIKAIAISCGIFAQHIIRYCDFGLGTEALWQYTNMEKNLNAKFREPGNADDVEFSIKTKTRSRSEFLLKPGYFINDYFTYAIAGLAFQSIGCKYTSIGKQGGANNPVLNDSAKKSHIVRGSVLGIGVQKNLYEHVDIAAEFKITKFSSRNYKFAVPGISQISLSNTLKNTSTNSYCLRFMYKF